MSPEQPGAWRLLKEIFHRATELEGEERAQYLDEACGSDAELRARVEELLKHDEQDTQFLESPEFADTTEDIAREERQPPFAKLGEYRLLREIGAGGSGVVYLARQESLGRVVAVKVLSPFRASTEARRERFRREATAAAKLDHPSIVRVHTVGEDQGIAFFAMDFVDGPSLDRELAGLALGAAGPARAFTPQASRPEVAARLAQQLAEALHHAHEHGIIHRDVKPQNVLIDEEGRPRLVDFGIAKDLDEPSLTKTGDLGGTPNYMSPEQVAARRVRVDHRTDVYSLGVVLYEMLTLERPFEAATAQQILHNITSRPARRVRKVNADVPLDLETICHKAMERDPVQRYESAGALAEDLQRFLAHQAILARPPSAWRRVQRWCARHRAATAAAILLPLAALAGWGVAAQRFGARLEEETGAFVTLVEDGESGVDLSGAEVSVQSMDAATGQFGESRPLGAMPIDRFHLPLGVHRILVRSGPTLFAEYDRLVDEPSEEIEIRVRLVDSASLEGSMTPVPGGPFTLELNLRAAGVAAGTTEQRHEIAPLLVDRTEVTIREYERFLREEGAALGLSRPDFWPDPVPEEALDHPATGMSFRAAQAFAESRGKRLPTKAEWEYAMRGGVANQRFPWGDEPGDVLARANVGREPLQDLKEDGWDARSWSWFLSHVEPAGRSAARDEGPFGLLHGFGNVSEWTASPVILRRNGRLDFGTNLYTAGVPCDFEARIALATDLGFDAWTQPTDRRRTLGLRCVRTRTRE